MQRNETDEYERYRYRYQKRGCGMHTIDIIILTVVAALLLLLFRLFGRKLFLQRRRQCGAVYGCRETGRYGHSLQNASD